MTLSLVVRTACLGVAATALSLSAALAAPPNLTSTNPSPKDGWRPFPKQLRLTFNEPIAASGAEVQMLGPDGRRIRITAPVVSKDTLSVTPQPSVDPPVAGPYMVTWQARSASGEEGKGDFSIFVQ